VIDVKVGRIQLSVVGSVGSTNAEAADMDVWSALLAREQAEGRGRLDHSWDSDPGGLYLSCVLPPADPPTLYQFWAAVVVTRALSEFGVGASVRWPNDILVDGRKIAGILSEHRGDRVIVGIGINVNNSVEDRPFPATSMLELTGRVSDVEGLARRILEIVQDVPAADEVMKMWREGSITEGKRVTVITLSGTISGRAVGIRDDGALLVDTGAGTETVTEGECRFA